MIWDSFKTALLMLSQHKLRAFLTMLGVIIGVMSVTLIVMISGGFQAYLTYQFQKLGSDQIFLFYDPGARRHSQTLGSIDGLKQSDITYLQERVRSVSLITGVSMPSADKVVYGTNESDSPRVQASYANFFQFNHMDLISGREMTKADVDSYANVCLIGQDISDKLFGTSDPIGKFVTLKGIALQVIGVIKRQTFMGDSTAKILVMPITTAEKKWVGGDKLGMILLRAKPGVSTKAAMQDVWQAMMAKSGNRKVYRIDSSESILGVFNGVIGVGGAILAAIAALSLLVGGIGIMNIMLVSVTERTREIGLRKAVGARRGSILVQFLIESGTLSLVGGLIGMGIAFFLGQLVSIATMVQHWPKDGGLTAPFPITAAIIAAGFSAAIGMIFGFYPAMAASKLDPIVALRTE